MSEPTLHLVAAAVTGLVALGHAFGAVFFLTSARRMAKDARRRRRVVLGLLLVFPAVLLGWYAVRDALRWGA